MAREIVIMTPEQVELRFELAGIGSRFIAMLVDTFVQGVLVTICILALFAMGALGSLSHAVESSSSLPIALLVLLVFMLFAIMYGYFLFFEAVKNGQTPGKKMVEIRVIRDTGHPLDFRSALLRNLMRIVDSLPGFYAVGLLSVFFSSECRRLGDYVGGTLVVKVGRSAEMLGRDAVAAAAPVSGSAEPQIVQPANLLPPEAMPFLGTISKEDYRIIRHFLDRKTELEDAVVRDLAKKLAEPIAQKLHLDFAGRDDPTSFLQAVGTEWERRLVH